MIEPVHKSLDRDMIFIAMEEWEGVWRRMQPLAAEFARRAPGRKILFVGNPINVTCGLRRGRFKPLVEALGGRAQLLRPADHPNVYLLNVGKWLPNSLGPARAANRWVERRAIRRACRRLGMHRPVLYMNPYYARHMVGRLGECLSVYDVGDDWTKARMGARELRRTIAEDAQLTRACDVMIVVSDHLRHMKQGMNARLLHIPNGVYVDRYAGVAEHTLPRDPLMRDWAGPVIGYTGTLHSERIDVDLLVAAARALPDATFALVGPEMLKPADRQRLADLPNVVMTGPLPFDRMPAVMSAFDVSIVPHLVTPFTESLSPLKLYEALASGLPTVSTPVAGFRDFAEHVDLADTADAFVGAIQRALLEPSARADARRAVARKHSWSRRIDLIESALVDALHARERTGRSIPAAISQSPVYSS